MNNLEVGYEFPSISYELTPSLVSKYEQAVEAQSSISNFVLPSAIAAFTMKAMSQAFDLPAGSVHVSQEFEFFKPIAVGSYIDCQARIIQKTTRGKVNMMIIELNTFDQNKERVLLGKTTLILNS